MWSSLQRTIARVIAHTDNGTRWHRWCTANQHCDWKKNVDRANADNSGIGEERGGDVPGDPLLDRVEEFKAHLFGMFSAARGPASRGRGREVKHGPPEVH